MADEATVHRTIDRYLASCSACDADAVMSLFAPGATIEDPVGFRPLHIEIVGNEAAFSLEVRPVSGDQRRPTGSQEDSG